ncbi:MAG: large subunit ribosomal protein L3 [Candidatus Magnetoglobus multicellularis str. Araruama]|uniref:50S ribosomal protein L3 n=1 Tax=Candidatus Magnetoglobus multicellularis str. Araruama TaxID=890399 RepID=A0A1V1NS74_9BACT|nr:MAG: large subunit ribosomal protein L3 [Candidatus Magnetoglobus multicellularis str. Araruama]
MKFLVEVSLEAQQDLKSGDAIDINLLEVGDKLKVRAKSSGKGFAGTVKRWNFTIGPKAHGSKNHRIPGSIGGGTGQSKVFKGQKMGGHMGDAWVTVKNLEVMFVDIEKNLVALKGPVPGKRKILFFYKQPNVKRRNEEW